MKDWRLETLSKNLNKKDIVADIGCDHAFAAIYIAENKLAKKVYASDNKEGPLKIAKENIKNASVKVESILGDGVEPYNDKNIKVDAYIIAGMGGGTIAKIIDKTNGQKLIMEPRNDFDKLRTKLKKMNYEIIDEEYKKSRREHTFITAIPALKKTNIKNEVDLIIGPIFKNNPTIDFKESIKNTKEKYLKLYQVSNNKKYKKIIKTIERWEKYDSKRNS